MSIVESFVEVKLKEDDCFLKIKETLTRIGVASSKNKVLYQSCHILHKQGRFYIVHFKEMFMLDGKDATFSEEDLGRRNTIAKLLSDWDLLTVVDKASIAEPRAPMNLIKILPFSEKKDWQLVEKYTIGKK